MPVPFRYLFCAFPHSVLAWCVDHFREAVCGLSVVWAWDIDRRHAHVGNRGRESGSESVTSQQRLRDLSGLWLLVRMVPSDHLCCTTYPVFVLSCRCCLFILRVREYTDLRDLRCVMPYVDRVDRCIPVHEE